MDTQITIQDNRNMLPSEISISIEHLSVKDVYQLDHLTQIVLDAIASHLCLHGGKDNDKLVSGFLASIAKSDSQDTQMYIPRKRCKQVDND